MDTMRISNIERVIVEIGPPNQSIRRFMIEINPSSNNYHIYSRNKLNSIAHEYSIAHPISVVKFTEWVFLKYIWYIQVRLGHNMFYNKPTHRMRLDICQANSENIPRRTKYNTIQNQAIVS
jgi:hypothetical protein